MPTMPICYLCKA